MNTKFVIADESIADRMFFMSDKSNKGDIVSDDQEITEPENNGVDIFVEVTSMTSNTQEAIVAEDAIEESENNLTKNDLEEIKTFSKARTLAQTQEHRLPTTSVVSTIIDEMLEKTFHSSEAVVASRLSYIRQISDLVSAHNSLSNAILALAENFQVVLPSDRINQMTGEITRVNVPVKRDGAFSQHEMALITIYLRKKIESFPETSKDLNHRLSSIESDLMFKTAQLTALRHKYKELEESQIPNQVSLFVIKRQGSSRYLSVKDKVVSAPKALSTEVIYSSFEEAEAALLFAIKRRERITVRKILTYEIIQLSYVAPMRPSDKIQEAIKNAYK